VTKVKTWNRTNLVWTEEYTTDVEISTWWDQRVTRKPPHSLSHISISSGPDGRSYGKIAFNGRSRSGLCRTDQEVFNERFQILKSQGVVVLWGVTRGNPDWYSCFADFHFELQSGEPFVDKAIGIAREIAKACGLKEQSLTDYLARFQVGQRTLVQHEGKWIGFADYLRHKHGLPALRGTGWSDTN
jgi:hypothetical protein